MSKPVNSLGKTLIDACMQCKETARGERATLRAENSRLKRASERDADVMESLNLSLEESQAENAKLRELVAKLHRCARGALRDLAPSCVDESKDGCGLDCIDNGERCCMILLEHCMHELGVEVD